MATLSAPPLPSERRFGISFALTLAVGGVYGLFQAWSPRIYMMCLLLSTAFLIVGTTAPQLLAPLNRAWFRLGQALGMIVNPIVLGLIFFALVTPIALVTRLLGRDELRLRRSTVTSYWLTRETSCNSDSFKHQF